MAIHHHIPAGRKVRTLDDLREQVRRALREQHREWVGSADGASMIETYEARFESLLSRLCPDDREAA